MGMGQYLLIQFLVGMNIHFPAILGFTRYQGFDPSPHGESNGQIVFLILDLNWIDFAVFF